jgi:hypothetical protein
MDIYLSADIQINFLLELSVLIIIVKQPREKFKLNMEFFVQYKTLNKK